MLVIAEVVSEFPPTASPLLPRNSGEADYEDDDA
jgi:hypothetical protein